MKIKRVYHRYDQLEECHCGMWKKFNGEKRNVFLKKAIKFTGNAEIYGEFMLRVIEEWPNSCEHNLTCPGMNRQAWIGCAACCLALNCPEDITREAWHMLDAKQQEDANKKADLAIREWEERYRQKLEVECPNDQLELTF